MSCGSRRPCEVQEKIGEKTAKTEGKRSMSQYVKEWIMTVVFLVTASAFFEGIFPGESIGKYLRYIFALVILSAVLSPVAVLFS